jgi:hypothetical protein
MPAGQFQSELLHNTLSQRFLGIHDMLRAAYEAGKDASSATKGFEREILVNLFLSQLFPPVFRFGSGDIIDQHNQRSGQVDIVVEFPFFPSLQTVITGPRLYLAENVAAAIEVKSNIAKQMDEVKSTSGAVKALRPRQGGLNGPRIVARDYTVPLFLVSFDGWKTAKNAIELLKEQVADGVLILNHGVCCGFLCEDGQSLKLRSVVKKPDSALWLFVSCLHDCLTRIRSMTACPFHYFKESDSSTPSLSSGA